MYGVSPHQKNEISLPKKLPKVANGSATRIAREKERLQSIDLLLDTLNEHCILLPLTQYDQQLNKQSKNGSRRGAAPKLVYARTILRGAAMDALVTAAGGDESILASGGAYTLLTSPWEYFRISPTDKEDRLAAAITKNIDDTIPALTQGLAIHFSTDPSISKLFSELAGLVRNSVFHTNTQAASNPRLKQLQLKRVTSSKKIRECGPTSVNAIITPALPFSLLPLASILREACNKHRSLPAADETLFRVLQGLSSTGGKPYPPEQTDPIRGNNAYTRLLLKILPPSKLTSPIGISALLAYMGTGQCTATEDFLMSNEGIFFEYQKCISAFQTAKSANDFTYHSNPSVQQAIAKSKQPKKFISGMKRFEFPQVWGQPCCHLSVQGGIEERFQPIFDIKVQNKWVEWLGPLADRNPSSFLPDERNSWRAALDFVQSLQIKGFCSGLTPLQFANNLCIAGIVAEPSGKDMIEWLYTNRELGASKGLQHLGFKPNTFRDFHATFLTVYGHLDKYLSTEDKQILHFGVIFVEHLLCKISRWKARLGSYSQLSSMIGGGPWIQGENGTDHLAFPIPENLDIQCLEAAVNEANVSFPL